MEAGCASARSAIGLFITAMLAIATGCCGDAECTDSVAIMINPSGLNPLPNGRYVLEAKLDGTTLRGECTLGELSTCTTDRVTLGRGVAGIAVAQVRAAPKHLELTISRDGAVILTTSFDPQYSKSQPNGDECGPTCHNAVWAASTN